MGIRLRSGRWSLAALSGAALLCGCADKDQSQVTRPRSGTTTGGTIKTTSADRGPNGTEIRVRENGIEIDGNVLSYPLEFGTLVKVIGQPTRSSALANVIHTWDQLGLLAYAQPGSTTIHVLVTAFRPRPFEFWPKRSFSRPLHVADHEIGATTGRTELERAGFGPDLFAAPLWSRQAGPVTVYVELEDEGNRSVVMVEINLRRATRQGK